MSEILLEVTRGPLVENIQRGDIAVVGRDGKLQYYKGDPFKVAYIRSSLKPIQTLNVFLSGADQQYHFDDKEISLMCASHYGEDIHRKVVNSILNKIGLKIDNLLCGSKYSLKEEYKIEQIANHVELTAANSDCSGKHGGMLASCLVKGYSTENYNLQNHPLQKDITQLVSNFCEIEEDKIAIGIDGCGVPVHGMPLYNAALGFAKLACPDGLVPELRDSCERTFTAMNNAPEMVAGTNGFCTELIKNTNGKLIGKIGADGVYCIAVKGLGIGIAIKMEDGNFNRIAPVVIRCLEDLGVLSSSEIEALEAFRNANVTNVLNNTVGEVNSAFHLDKAEIAITEV
ncbi:asparaginase [Priestia megaterium]|uniref:asparaginase n=1 Tax=Priestia megaterium TaxID=1404 RepID=UPI00366D3F19